MKTLTLDEYIDYYTKYKRLPNNQYVNRDKTLNEKQLKSKYEDYLKKLDKQEIKRNLDFQKAKDKRTKQFEDISKNGFPVDEQWEEVKKIVYARDMNTCQLFSKLNPTRISDEVINNLKYNKELSRLDPAHVFGKGSYPKLKYESDNIVVLYRLFHSRLDTYCDPLTGKSIDKIAHANWWRFIIGDILYDDLVERSRK